jgi:hypothetical protein
MARKPRRHYGVTIDKIEEIAVYSFTDPRAVRRGNRAQRRRELQERYEQAYEIEVPPVPAPTRSPS